MRKVEIPFSGSIENEYGISLQSWRALQYRGYNEKNDLMMVKRCSLY